MRIALIAVLSAHGALHLLGFLKWSGLAALPALSGPTLVPLPGSFGLAFAALWVLAFAGLQVAAIFQIGRLDNWWVPALIGALVSQAVIVVAWQDAKYGTLANVWILAAISMAVAHSHFQRTVDTEVRALFAEVESPQEMIRPDELAPLPVPVRRWLEASGSMARPRVTSVRLKQRGDLRLSPDAAWMPAVAEQYFTVDEPAFIWRVETTLLGFLPVTGRDKYQAGAGHMLIKAASLVNLVNAADDKIAHGSLLRFLGEIVWFPAAALSPYIHWQSADPKSALATIQHAGQTASAVFTFDEKGRVVSLFASRYLGGGEDAKLTPWSVTCSEWRTLEGVEIPVRGEVSWKLPRGDFVYYRWQILEAEYNRAELYGADPSGQNTPLGVTRPRAVSRPSSAPLPMLQ